MFDFAVATKVAMGCGMSLGDRIKALLDAQGKSQADLARAIGVTPQAISKLVSGATAETPKLHLIARFFETTPEALLGQDETAAPARAVVQHDAKTSRGDDDQVEIDSIDLAYGMGGAYLDSDTVETEKLRFPLAWLRQFTDSPAHLLTMAHGIGDSMEPTISDRDSVLIDRGATSLRDSTGERIWAAVFGGVGVIKRLRPMPNGTVKIMSDNPLVSDDIATDGDLFIIGRVVGKSSRL